jgi:hypothetical protein
MIIQPIVEGQGEVAAVPVLLRRLRDEAQAWGIEVARPHKKSRPLLAQKDYLQDSVRVAMLTPGCAAILILFDADDDCPRELAQRLEMWAQEVAAGIACAVVIANREYEAWFLAGMEALRGKQGILANADSHPEPERPRGAKSELEQRMARGKSYSPPVDQVKLTYHLDLKSAYRRCRSFRKLVTAFGSLVAAAGVSTAVWPPTDWMEANAILPQPPAPT